MSVNRESVTLPGVDALMPADMARRSEEIGTRKANMDAASMLALAVLAGAFIALGAMLATVALTGTNGIPWGWSRIVAGIVFSLGLILVVVGGAELFTGNNLVIMAWASRRVSTRRLLYSWLIVYLGNFIGAVMTALFVFWGHQFEMNNGAAGLTALNIGLTKVHLGFGQAVVLGALCNALVCLAVWLTYSGRSVIDKIAAIVFPITAFVAAGFEHSIANMYFIPLALLIKNNASETFWQAINASPAAYRDITLGNFLLHNLLPVTIGNIIGGVFLVAIVYWSVYLRRK